MITDYIKSFDHTIGAWKKKGEATQFADFLAPELGINRKGVVWEKDGSNHRLYVPLISQYWHPTKADDWETELLAFQGLVRTWASE